MGVSAVEPQICTVYMLTLHAFYVTYLVHQKLTFFGLSDLEYHM